MSSQASSLVRKPPKVKQACDCCHARKIRCDGTKPCNNCQLTSLQCTYLSVPKKKGPKGPSKRTPRAILKMQMRQETDKSAEKHYVLVRPTISPSTAPSIPSIPSFASPKITEPIKPQEPLSTTSFQASPFITQEILERYLETFFKHKYAVLPILQRDRIYAILPTFRTSAELYALLTSLCAALVTQTQPDTQSVSSPGAASNDGMPNAEFFMAEARRARGFRDYVEKPSISDAQTSFFLFAALFNYDRHNSAWFCLREAMTILQLLRLHEDDTYLGMDPEEALFSRRTFWLLFVTERAYALQRHRPLTLQRTIALPDPCLDSPDGPIISGFLDLVSLFQNFDDTFVTLWNTSSQASAMGFSGTDEQAVMQLAALQSILAMSLPDVSQRSATQQADLLISRQWLKTMTWQLCVTKGLLSSASQDESMSFQYPVTIARDVVVASRLLKKEAFEPHGPGILEKIFDIGCSLADVLQLYPTASNAVAPSMDVGPRDYLLEMIRLCSTVLGGSSKYVSLLAAKADECFRVGPRDIDPGNGGRIIELEGEGDDADFDAAKLAVYDSGSNGYVTNESEMFDFGSLSDVSMAWLGSMSNEPFVDMEEMQMDGMKYDYD